jgi:L-ribulose-5-phosphate 3-epimerase
MPNNIMNANISRKQFIRNSVIAAAAIPLGLSKLSAAVLPESAGVPSISIFSKHLHWLSYKDMAALAAQLGYDGVDLTVRKDGHVLPENVATDLPKAVDAIRNAGLEVYTITTDIRTAEEQHTAAILKIASEQGIKNYRMGWYGYTGKDIQSDLETFKSNLKGLAAINEHYQIHGDYENHTERFGGPIWDLWLSLKDLDPRWIGIQFDIRHATVDGAEAWPKNLELIHKYLGSITIKDFHWEKKADKWTMQNVALGQGMIDFKKYFKLLKQYGFKKPISQHFEYPMGGAESGASKLSIPKEQVINHMQKDLETLKSLIKQEM